MFYQVIELVPSIKYNEMVVQKLGNKIAALLDVEVKPKKGK